LCDQAASDIAPLIGWPHCVGAVGQYGSIAVVERFIRTMKDECTRCVIIPHRREDMRRELGLYLARLA